jgi:hypothetical protein
VAASRWKYRVSEAADVPVGYVPVREYAYLERLLEFLLEFQFVLVRTDWCSCDSSYHNDRPFCNGLCFKLVQSQHADVPNYDGYTTLVSRNEAL